MVIMFSPVVLRQQNKIKAEEKKKKEEEAQQKTETLNLKHNC